MHECVCVCVCIQTKNIFNIITYKSTRKHRAGNHYEPILCPFCNLVEPVVGRRTEQMTNWTSKNRKNQINLEESTCLAFSRTHRQSFVGPPALINTCLWVLPLRWETVSARHRCSKKSKMWFALGQKDVTQLQSVTSVRRRRLVSSKTAAVARSKGTISTLP